MLLVLTAGILLCYTMFWLQIISSIFIHVYVQCGGFLRERVGFFHYLLHLVVFCDIDVIVFFCTRADQLSIAQCVLFNMWHLNGKSCTHTDLSNISKLLFYRWLVCFTFSIRFFFFSGQQTHLIIVLFQLRSWLKSDSYQDFTTAFMYGGLSFCWLLLYKAIWRQQVCVSFF